MDDLNFKFKRNYIQFSVFMTLFAITMVLLVMSYNVAELTNHKTDLAVDGIEETPGLDGDPTTSVFFILIAPVFLFHALWLLYTSYVEIDDVVVSIYYTFRKSRHFKYENIAKIEKSDSVIVLHHKQGYKAEIKARLMREEDFKNLGLELDKHWKK